MEDKTISAMSSAASLNGTELVPIVKSEVNQKTTVSKIVAKAQEGVVKEVSGKGLSTNDYTDADKTKLAALPTRAGLDLELDGTINDAMLKMLINDAEAIGAVYNSASGYFEMNGLTDLTAKDMHRILLFGKMTFCSPGECGHVVKQLSSTLPTSTIRTNWVQWNADSVYASCDVRYTLYSQSVEIIIGPKRDDQYNLTPTTLRGFCWNCRKLQVIDMIIMLTNIVANEHNLFSNCPVLKTVYLKNAKVSFRIKDCPLLSLASVLYIVTNAANTSPITITVHPDVYAKLTGDTTNAAAAALTPEELAQWQQVLTDATAKNIRFATV